MSDPRYGPLFVGAPVSPSPSSLLERLPITVDLRESEVRRLQRSAAGLCDFALIQMLGTQFRYLRRDQIGVLYRDLTAPALSRRLSLLWRAQWVNRNS